MSRYLIVYGTKEGQTAKISDRIGGIIRDRGHDVDVYDAALVPSSFDMNDYKAAFIGSSIHMMQWSRPAIEFAHSYKSQLEKIPSAFFAVSMSAVSPRSPDGVPPSDNPFIHSFFDKSGWHPNVVGNFGGALMYTKYGYFTRWLMVLINGWRLGARDTSHDIEFTDWKQVSKFAEDFVDEAEKAHQ